MFINSLFVKTKFSKDLYWNLFGFIIIAISGLSINILIVHFYNFETLGFFNLLLVFFLVLPQILSWGIPLSIQKLVPQHKNAKRFCQELFSSALLTTIALSTLGVLILYFVKTLPGIWMDNTLLEKGFVYLLVGIGLASINKIFFGFLNGMRFMMTFAVYNTLRVVLMVLVLILYVWQKIDAVHFGLLFTLPEAIIFLGLLAHLKKWLVFVRFWELKKLMSLHIWYGNRSLIGTVVTTFQSKVDIFILGFFVPNAILGVYSFAVFVVDGFYQIFYVFRININPIITEIYYHRSSNLMSRVIQGNIQKFFKVSIILGLLIAVIYPVILYFFEFIDYISVNLEIFYILLIGVLLGSGYIPFQFYFNQIGKPKKQTYFLSAVFIVTVFLCLIFVKLMGVFGVAIALGLANISQMIYLKQTFSKIK